MRYYFVCAVSLLYLVAPLASQAGDAEYLQERENVEKSGVYYAQVQPLLKRSLLMALVPASLPILRLLHAAHTAPIVQSGRGVVIPDRSTTVLRRFWHIEGRQSLRLWCKWTVLMCVAQELWRVWTQRSQHSGSSE